MKNYTIKRTLLTITLIFVMLSSITVSAQESVIEDINYTQLEQFIEMAKENYPRNKVMALMETKAKDLPTMEALTYLNMFNASYYYRPNERASINPDNPYTVNGFQFGISTSLGTLVGTPYRIKQAKIDYKIAQLESVDYGKILTLEVKNRYYNYILQLKELKLVTQIAQDSKGIADDIAIRFERGEIELDGYNTSKSAFNSANSAKIRTEVSFLLARDQLEDIIGKKLTEFETN